MSRTGGARVVRASAGTGKTRSLTNHYLGLIARGVSPERCLATTFTRKAAGEILDRIFSRLVAAARDETKRAELDLDLGGGLPTCAAAAQLVVGLARRIDGCRVMTLDAFFVVLARALSAEIGLPPDWRIADEFHEARARETAVARALERGSIQRWVLLLRELERSKVKRAVHETLVKLMDATHEVYLEASQGAWDALRVRPPLAADERQRLARRLAGLELPLTQAGTPVKSWVESMAEARECLAAPDWNDFGGKGIAQALLSGSAAFSRRPISEPVREVFSALLHEAAADQGRLVASQNRATRTLIADFDRELQGLIGERGQVRFADLPRVLARRAAARVGLAEDLEWRLGARIDHLLLDEFQDTAPAQWRVLAPLAEALAADGSGEQSFFCVGDTKQSIYGWRGGDPRLLDGVARWPTVEVQRLSRSWRSAQVILEVVNRVFGDLAANPVLVGQPELLSACAAFQFEPHTSGRPEQRGVVRAIVAHVSADTQADAESKRAACLDAAAERVVELAARAPRASIGILVRRKAQVAALVQRLRRRGLAASGEAGNPLTDARSVQLALSALHLSGHPSDSAALFHVAHSPLGARLGFLPGAELASVVARARDLRRSLVERGYAATLESFRAAFAAESPWERRRFERLIELAIAWESEPTLASGAFVRRVRDERVEDPSSAAIKVMTIHAAKGLEFDAVVLPDLGYEFARRPPALEWRRAGDDPTREIDALSRSTSKELRALLSFAGEPLLAELHGATRTRELYDELCALYVALTRARHELDLILAQVETDKPGLSSGAILALALGLADRAADSPAWLAEGSDAGWVDDFGAAPGESALSAQAETPRVDFGAASAAPRQRPASATHARRTPLRLLFADSAGARRRGKRLHAWLECVAWLEDFRATDAELLARARERELDGEGVEVDLAAFRRMLAGEAAERMLGRPAGECALWRERRYVLQLESGELARGVFDRVTIERAGGVPVRARIVDFKSDADLGDETRLAARVEHHAPQLYAYRAALARILALDPTAIEAQLWFLEVGAVRAVAPA